VFPVRVIFAHSEEYLVEEPRIDIYAFPPFPFINVHNPDPVGFICVTYIFHKILILFISLFTRVCGSNTHRKPYIEGSRPLEKT